MFEIVLTVIIVSFVLKLYMILRVFFRHSKHRPVNSNVQRSKPSNTSDYSRDNSAYKPVLPDQMNQEQNRLFLEQVQREQFQRDVDEAARFSMNSSYNAMSDANYACTGIDSFGHNPF